LALAYLRVNVQMTNADYRRLHHGAVETVEATRELRGLVETGLVEMHGIRRWAYYTLSEEVLPRVQGLIRQVGTKRWARYVLF